MLSRSNKQTINQEPSVAEVPSSDYHHITKQMIPQLGTPKYFPACDANGGATINCASRVCNCNSCGNTVSIEANINSHVIEKTCKYTCSFVGIPFVKSSSIGRVLRFRINPIKSEEHSPVKTFRCRIYPKNSEFWNCGSQNSGQYLFLPAPWDNVCRSFFRFHICS